MTFEELDDGRYRAVAFDGAVIHTCSTEKERSEVDRLTELDPSQWYAELVAGHADGEIRREDVEDCEAWNRLSGEPHLFGVEAIRDEESAWQVSFWVLEFVREEPLESQLRAAIVTSLRAVAGVVDVQEEDREVYSGHRIAGR